MAVVEKTWYKELEDPDTFYTKVTALKLLDHLTEFFGASHCGRGGYYATREDALQGFRGDTTVHQLNGGSIAQIQACKTRHQRQVSARWDLRYAASIALMNCGIPSESL